MERAIRFMHGADTDPAAFTARGFVPKITEIGLQQDAYSIDSFAEVCVGRINRVRTDTLRLPAD